MKKIIAITAIISLFAAGNLFAAAAEDDENPREFNVKGVSGGVSTSTASADEAAPEGAGKKEKIIQVGALEKKDGDKLLLRKISSWLEFYIADNAVIYLKSDSSFDGICEKCYLDVRGPKNKKAVLANTVYIYSNKKEYNDMQDREQQELASKKGFSAPITGYVKQKDPLIIALDDNREYLVSCDEDTYWVLNKAVTKNEINIGDRLKLFFDKRLSARYKSEAVKVIIDKSKAEN